MTTKTRTRHTPQSEAFAAALTRADHTPAALTLPEPVAGANVGPPHRSEFPPSVWCVLAGGCRCREGLAAVVRAGQWREAIDRGQSVRRIAAAAGIPDLQVEKEVAAVRRLSR